MDDSASTKSNTPQRRGRLSPDERRSQILDAAQALFFARGWEAVTIADVLAEVGISKGGFYHHFTAKEDLLDGVVNRFTIRALDAADAARGRTDGDALAQFNEFLAESNRWKAEQAQQLRFFMDAMLRPGNELLSHRISDTVADATRPVLRKILADGAAEGTFDIPDVDLVSETILNLSHGRREILGAAIRIAEAGDLDGAAARLTDRMSAEGVLIDRLLGLQPGSVALSQPDEYRLMLRAMTQG